MDFFILFLSIPHDWSKPHISSNSWKNQCMAASDVMTLLQPTPSIDALINIALDTRIIMNIKNNGPYLNNLWVTTYLDNVKDMGDIVLSIKTPSKVQEIIRTRIDTFNF